MIFKKEILILGLLLSVLLASGIYYARTNSITTDEKSHITAGYLNVRFNDYRFNIEHPPLAKQLAALPLLCMDLQFPQQIHKESSIGRDIVKIQEAFLFTMGNNLDAMLFFARLPNILFAVLLGIFIYIFSKELNGSIAGFISLALFIFSPTFLGHSSLVTMDVPVSCFYFMTVYFLMKYFSTQKNKFLYIAGIGLGISLAAKFSALILIPALYMLVIIMIFTKYFKSHNFDSKVPLWKIILGIPLFVFAVSYKGSVRFMIPVFIFFLISLAFHRFKFFNKNVRFAARISLILLLLGFSVVILDYTQYNWFPFHSATKAYFKGFAYFQGHAAGGHDAYLLGRYSHTGWWYYFPLSIFFKEPLTMLGVMILGFIGLWVKKEKDWRILFLFIPLCAYLFAACFINKVNIGIRHILPIYPFLYVIAGYSVVVCKKYFSQRGAQIITVITVLLLAVEVVSGYPAHLSYFNIASGGAHYGYKLLGDSNIAWGQDWKRLKGYIQKNNIKKIKIYAIFRGRGLLAYYKIPYEEFNSQDKIAPAEGFYVIDTIQLQKSDIVWLDKYTPLAYVGGSLLVYKIESKTI